MASISSRRKAKGLTAALCLLHSLPACPRPACVLSVLLHPCPLHSRPTVSCESLVLALSQGLCTGYSSCLENSPPHSNLSKGCSCSTFRSLFLSPPQRRFADHSCPPPLSISLTCLPPPLNTYTSKNVRLGAFSWCFHCETLNS